MKKVSVIVPVYNAEKYLGYCVNSILSQTYNDLEVILVNDGSTDGSLKICNNYRLIDERVLVIDIPNGGVGNARNIGMMRATGEYLQFVDSDDVIAQTMVEKLVGAIEAYKKDIVFCGLEIVVLDDNLPEKRFSCTSEGIGKECVLERNVFFEKMAFLLWKTAILEGPCNRVYRMKIIKENNIKFPTDISLGEDFIFNMEYYNYCNGAVFLSEKLYYYVQINDNALTSIYRPEIFENQMMLIEKFREFLKSNITISKEEKKNLAEYTVAKAIQCMLHLFQDNCDLSELEKKAQIALILNDSRVRAAITRSDFIDERYEWIRWLSDFTDVGAIYKNIGNVTKRNKISTTFEYAKTPGMVNKGLVCLLNEVLKIRNIRILEMVRNSLVDFGIKATIKKCLTYQTQKSN